MIIHAFLERLCPYGCTIVRAGPEAKIYADPFDFAMVYVEREGKAIVKALVVPVVPWWLRWLIRIRPFTRAYYKAVLNAIPMPAEWERHNLGH
jgi:hypothetical protein